MGAVLTPVAELIRDWEVHVEHHGDSGATAGATPGPAGPTPAPDRDEPVWLYEVRLRALRRVLFLRQQWQSSSYPGEEDLAISHSEVDRALLPDLHSHDQAAAFYQLDDEARSVGQALESLAREPKDPVWSHLVETLHVTPGEESLLKLALATAADPRLTRVLGYLQDGTAPSGATVSLVDQIFDVAGGARVPAPGSALYRWRLLEPEAPVGQTPSDATVFRADASLVDTLMGRLDARDWSAGTTGRVLAPPPDGGVRPELAREIAVFAGQVLQGAGTASPIHVEAELVGPPGSGRRALGAAASALIQAAVIGVDCATLAEAADPELLLVREVRRVVLSRAALAVWHHETLPAPARAVTTRCPLTFSCVERPLGAIGGTTAPTVRRSYTLPPLQRHQRLALWASLSTAPAPGPVAEWGLRPGEIEVAARTLPAGPGAVADVVRSMLATGIDDLLTRLPPGPTWDDLVLPPDTRAHLRELEAQVRYKDDVLDGWNLARLTPLGRGTTALFSGPSGTGKTMTAQVLAASLGLDCLRVDLAGVVSKYIGETEKQLRKVFEACERSPSLLFFDEADALFGKRTTVVDAHDRFANIEIDYVLQAMEQFNGLAVLATNRKGDLDPAFTRRLRFVVNFVPPGPAERQALWRACFDGAVDAEGRPLTEGIDIPHLAEKLDLTGAQIKSAALAAAFMARDAGTPITMDEVIAAAGREIEKLGKVVRAGQLEWR